MKKQLFYFGRNVFFALAFIFCVTCANAQVYLMVQDSSIQKNQSNTDTVVMKYVYDSHLSLTRINYFWGSNSMPNGYDVVYTNASGRIDSLVNYDQTTTRSGAYLKNTWSGSDLIKQERAEKHGPGNISMQTNYYTYNSGVISAWVTKRDTGSGGGGPDSLTNIVINGGNFVSGTLYMGGVGSAVIVEYDSMPNPYKGWAVSDEFPLYFTANNMRKAFSTNPPMVYVQNAFSYSSGRLASKTQADSGRNQENHYSYAFFVGVDEIVTQSPIVIYPNPSSVGIFNIDISGINTLTAMEVYDCTGKQIINRSNQANLDGIQKIDLSNQAKGIYFLKLLAGNTIKTARMVVQ